jgi:predicted nuclease of predicted toxin-antitoxin system
MKMIANENIAGAVVRELRRRGHDVLSVKESMRGAADRAVLLRAGAERRLIVTHDKDFGELAFRHRHPASCGIILFRLSGADPSADHRRVLEVIDSRSDWIGQFSVVTDDRIRMRRLAE